MTIASDYSKPVTSHAYHQALLTSVSALVPEEGIVDTCINGVTVFRSCKHNPAKPLIYNPCVAVILQGYKIGHVGAEKIYYGPGEYLLQTLPLPFECETVGSTALPAIGIRIDFDPLILAELVQTLPANNTEELERFQPMASITMHDEMAYAVKQLLQVINEPSLASVLGESRLREITYEALRGPHGNALRAVAMDNSHYARVARSLLTISDNLDQEFNVSELAKEAGMSVSGFHASFKQVTQTSPIQYLKRCRLLQAQSKISGRFGSMSQIASEVGYTSMSQFSRDYKKLFGHPPSQERVVNLSA